MSASPLPFRWTGDSFEPISPYFAKECDKRYVVGEVYNLEVREERSSAAHKAFFAEINEAWKNLPEHLSQQYPSEKHLRARALVQAGFYDEMILDVGTRAAAIRAAAQFRVDNAFAYVFVRGGIVIRRTPKSQAYRAMPKAEFNRSAEAVRAIIAELIGTSTEALTQNAEQAA